MLYTRIQKYLWQRYITGEHVKDIFESLGYDTNILDDGSIYNFSHVLSLKMLNQNGLNGNHSKGATVESIDVASMQHEIVYLRQQVEFLKKNYIAGRNEKTEKLIMESTSNKFQLIYDIVSKEDNVLKIKELCRIAGVSR